MSTRAKIFTFLLCLFFYYNKNAFGIHSVRAATDHQIKCVKKERQALLKFKQEVIDLYNRLSSWGSEEYKTDCCKWQGVYCDNRTGNVIRLNLRGLPGFSLYVRLEPLRGEISTSLLELKYMEHLDLSYNEFSGSIPLFLGSFTKLNYLNLSGAVFYGIIPPQLGNLTSLQTLDRSFNSFSVDNLWWLFPLQSLRNLDLRGVDLRNATDWTDAVTSLPMLRVLHLSDCNLPSVTLSSLNSLNSSAYLTVLDVSSNNLSSSSVYSWLFNFSNSLTKLNLSNNNLQGPIPNGFANLVSLMHLDLSYNQLEGGVPSYFGNYRRLKSLILSDNSLKGYMPELMKSLFEVALTLEYLNLDRNLMSGPLPDTIGKFSCLKELRLSLNTLNGSMPKVIGQLSNLTVLDLTGNEISGPVPDFLLASSLRELHLGQNQLRGVLTESIGLISNLEKLYLGSNHLEGVISESHLLNLTQLQILDLSFNSHLELRFHSGWIAPFQLDVLRLGHCKIGPHFPKWLQFQDNISMIDMSDAAISDDIPSWFWDQMSGLKVLNLSFNLMGGTLPDLYTKVSDLYLVDLTSNNFEGPVPRLPYTVTVADLSRNRFSGGITFLCNSSYDNLGYLDLSNNQLFGELPDCCSHLRMLVYLNLANNNLSGKIPSSMGFLSVIQTLQLRNNSFTEELPKSWQDSRLLNFIDLGQNRLSGPIPEWMGSNSSNVVVLSLSSNNFSGSITENICKLSRIQILDLSGNKISGTIPKCISNFSAMTQEGSSRKSIDHWYWYRSPEIETNISYSEKAFLVWKGRESQYKSTLGLVKSIDLSSNNLTGDIPLEVTCLIGLIGLNLSRNHLTGTLAPQIGKLELLNFLDLSRNHLQGEVPPSLSQLSHLGVFDLSFNNFTGRIPTGTQLQTYNASSYAGNPGLCGKPLTKACPGDELPENPNSNAGVEEHDEEFITKGFYLSMALGFIFGFWGVCGTLFLNRSLRHTFFEFISNVQDWFYVIIALKMSQLRRLLHR